VRRHDNNITLHHFKQLLHESGAQLAAFSEYIPLFFFTPESEDLKYFLSIAVQDAASRLQLCASTSRHVRQYCYIRTCSWQMTPIFSYLFFCLLFGASTGGQNALIISSYIIFNHPGQRDDALTAVP